VIRALKAVNVPVIVVADFDVLREAATIRAVCEAMGDDWSTFAARHGVLVSSLSQGAKIPSRTAIREAISNRLDEADETLTVKDLEEIRRVLRIETGWDRVKAAGLAAVPQGNAAEAAEAIVTELTNLGVLVVPVGELERFEPSVPGHGPSWVNEVLSRGKHAAPSKEATDFLSRLESVAREQSGLGS
jgi:hypothetical protein